MTQFLKARNAAIACTAVEFMNDIHQTFWFFTHQLLFKGVAHLWQEFQQHMQQLSGQLGFIGRLAQRQLPVQGDIRLRINICYRWRGLAGNHLARLITQQQGAQFLFFNRLREIVIHACRQ